LSHIEHFQIEICSAHSQLKRHGERFFQICIFFKKKNSNTIFTRWFWIPFPPINLYLICLQLNLSSIQLTLNPIVELNLVELEFNSIQVALQCCSCLIIFHFKNVGKIFLLHKDIYLFLVFPMFLVLVQMKKIYSVLLIASYHYYLLAQIHVC